MEAQITRVPRASFNWRINHRREQFDLMVFPQLKTSSVPRLHPSDRGVVLNVHLDGDLGGLPSCIYVCIHSLTSPHPAPPAHTLAPTTHLRELPTTTTRRTRGARYWVLSFGSVRICIRFQDTIRTWNTRDHAPNSKTRTWWPEEDRYTARAPHVASIGARALAPRALPLPQHSAHARLGKSSSSAGTWHLLALSSSLSRRTWPHAMVRPRSDKTWSAMELPTCW